MESKFEQDSHRRYTSSVRRSMPSTSGILGLVFGIFMFLVYEGMGVLMFINFFGWRGDWEWTRWILGVVFVLYGIFRGFRTFRSIKTHGNTDDDV